MLESYFQEIKQKRRRKMFFWVIVLIFAVFLYFFFKGKYMSVNIDFQNFFSKTPTENTQNLPEESESEAKNPIFAFNSFGVVNVKVVPKDATIWLNEKNYTNDSTPWLDYGAYSLAIWRENYLDANINFDITEEKNFYINTISLLKKPQYQKSPLIQDGRIVNIWNNSWIGYTPNGMMLYQENFSTGSLISRANFDHLGEGIFSNGKTLMSYNILEGKWIPNASPFVANFLKKCPTLTIKNTLLYCEKTAEAMLDTGKLFSNVTLVGKNFLKTDKSVFLGDFSSGNIRTFPMNSILSDSNTFVEIGGEWYTNSKNLLIPVNPSSINAPLFALDMDAVTFADIIDKTLFVIGTTENEKILHIFDLNDTKKTRTIKIPNDAELADIRLYKNNGNYFLKTKNSLLFLYNDGNILEWIIHGKILAVSDTFALYETNFEIWLADWNDKKILEKK